MTDPQSADQSFPPAARFHNRRDYGRVFHRQQKAAGRHVVVLVAPRTPREGKQSRLGIMVSTKVHKHAVRRHQLKRWVRELFRRELQHTLEAWDVCVLFRSNPPDDGHTALDDEIRRSLAKALKRQPDPGGNRRPRKKGGRGGKSGKGKKTSTNNNK